MMWFVVLLAWCSSQSKQNITHNSTTNNVKISNLSLATWFDFWDFSLSLTGQLSFSWEKSIWEWVEYLRKFKIDNGTIDIYKLWYYDKVNKSMKNNIKKLQSKPWFLLLNNSYYHWTGFTISNMMYQLNWKSYLSMFITDRALQVYLLKYTTTKSSDVLNMYELITKRIKYNK